MWYVIWAVSTKEYELEQRMKLTLPPDLYKRIWIPVREELRMYQGVEKMVEVKLFPGYVFVETDDPEEIHERIRREPAYIKFLDTEKGITPISLWEEELIRLLTDEKGKAGLSVGIIDGGRLKVLQGPLKGKEDQIIRIDRHKKKAWIEMALLGEKRKVGLGLRIVAKS